MYIGFNAVGSDVIHGTQFRYLFPLMCPMFYFLIPQSSVNIFTPRKYTAIIFTGLVFNLFSGYLLAYLIYI